MTCLQCYGGNSEIVGGTPWTNYLPIIIPFIIFTIAALLFKCKERLAGVAQAHFGNIRRSPIQPHSNHNQLADRHPIDRCCIEADGRVSRRRLATTSLAVSSPSPTSNPSKVLRSKSIFLAHLFLSDNRLYISLVTHDSFAIFTRSHRTELKTVYK